jgi:hypothetical protein
MFLCPLSCLLSESCVFVIRIHCGRCKCERVLHGLFFLISQSKSFQSLHPFKPPYQLQFMLFVTLRPFCFSQALSHLAMLTFAVSSSPGLVGQNILSNTEVNKSPYKTFKNIELNSFFCRHPKRIRIHNSPLRDPTLKQIRSGNLISALWDLQDRTEFLNTSAQSSEHNMLVYDQQRASIQHKIANVVILSPNFKLFISLILPLCSCHI